MSGIHFTQKYGDQMQSLSTIPIAIIGLSLRFPDDADSAESFWSMLEEGRCASREFPPDRLDGSALFDADRNRTESIALKGGHFINENVASFDAPFFSISAAEAAAMDPQSRMLLETTYRALENAGISTEQVSNSNTSVYSGSLSVDYSNIVSWDLEHGSKYSLMGTSSLLSGRLSWFFNLLGPNLTLDTACSSSLVALDLGCQSLLSNTSDMSIVTGSNLLFSPQLFHLLGNFGMLSPDSKCYSFDHRANGYGRGEGIATIVLKRLPNAIKNNDTIRAVIRSTGTNHDGRTPGMSQPSKRSQALLIRETYAKANLSMEPTRYFEAHGTGTPVGDPIEASAIGEAFRQARSPSDPIYVGSVKSNIGHLEGTSGLASVIKAVLALERGTIPPNANFERLNDRIDGDGLHIKIPVIPTPWPVKGLRRISVNSFGASGTNAHVVLDDAYHCLLEQGLNGNHCTIPDTGLPRVVVSNGDFQARNGDCAKKFGLHVGIPRVLILSASEKPALHRMIGLYNDWFQKYDRKSEHSVSLIDNLAYTLNARRTRLPYRSFVVLDDVRRSQDLSALASPPVRATSDPNCAFIFTGQGAQWAGMGRELLRFPAFRENVLESNNYLDQLGNTWDLLNVLNSTEYETAVNRPGLSQTLCTVLQIAICDLCSSLNLLPSAVVGHSSGEIAAAYCIGAISKHSALELAYHRGVLSENTSKHANWGMMAIAMSATNTELILVNINNSKPTPVLFVACINSPESVTISGDLIHLNELSAILQEQKIFHRRLQVDTAYHSPYMESTAAAYMKILRPLASGMTGRRSAIMISSVTGEVIDHKALQQVEYWVRNMLQTVRFEDAMKRLCCPPEAARRKRLDGSHRKYVTVQQLVEIGPHATLRKPIEDTLKDQSGATVTIYYSVLQRKHPADKTFLSVLGHMACHGFNINLDAANNLDHVQEEGITRDQVLPNLPEYPFDRYRTYWTEGRLGNEYRFRQHRKLDLLGKPVIDWNPLEPRWQNFLKLSDMPWVGDHKIDGTVIYPAAGMMIMAIEASKQVVDKTRLIKGFKLADNQFPVALVIPTTPEGIETQFVLRPMRDDTNRNSSSWEFRLYSCEGSQWHEHCRGNLQVQYEHEPNILQKGQESQEVLERSRRLHFFAEKMSKWTRTNDEFYSALWKSGYTFGPSFRIMDNISFSEHGLYQATADVHCFQWLAVDDANHYQEHVVHPTTLDGILQTTLALFSRAGESSMPTSVPMRIDELWISANGLSFPQTNSVKSRGCLTHRGNVGYDCDVTALDKSCRKILVQAKRVSLRHVTEALSSNQRPSDPHTCYNIQWKPDIDILDSKHTECGSSRIQRRFKNALDCVSNLLELATFKQPGMKIMQISNALNKDTTQLLHNFFALEDEIGSTLPFGEYTLAEISDLSLERAIKLVENQKKINVASWENITTSHSKASELNHFDLILIPWSAKILQVVAHAHRMLNAGGRIVLFAADDLVPRKMTTDELETSLLKNDLQRVQNCYSSGPNDDVVFTAVKPSQAPVSNQHSKYILLAENSTEYQQKVATLLKDLLDSVFSSCEISDIETLQHSDDGSDTTYIFLYELEHPILEELTSELFLRLKRILLSAKKILWLTCQNDNGYLVPSQGMIDGLAGVLRSENDGLAILTVSLEKKPIDRLVNDVFTLIRHNGSESADHEYETHYRQVDGHFNIARMIPAHQVSQEVYLKSLPVRSKTERLEECPPLRLTIETPGLLDSLHFAEDVAHHEPLAPDEIEMQTRFVGLNFKDLLVALGRVNGSTLGNECAGVVARAGALTEFQPGDRVCVFNPTAFNSYTRAKAHCVARIPDGLSLAYAASIPLQFTTAYYAIHHLARLQKGETVLIHSGAGGTGQACIQIAQALGGVIFATVSSQEKKSLLVEEYGIPESHVFYSRDTSFSRGILEATRERGVDVILNSLSGDSLVASWNVIAPYGRFIELGRKDIDMNGNLPMRSFQRGASFMALESSAVAADKPQLVRQVIEHLMSMMLKGTIRPVCPFQILPVSDIKRGMRMLQEGDTMGKIVFDYTNDMRVPVTLKTRPSFFFDANKTYVIAGGTGGIGRAVAAWMVKERGAKHLLLLSRSGMQNKDAAKAVYDLRQIGASVEAPGCDICDKLALQAVLESYQGIMPPFGGCIQASMVLKDGLFANMSYDDWRASTDVKTTGSWNLHTLLPKGLDFFIMLSSVAGILGSAGQANYAAGNTYLDALAHYRVSQGERATSVDLGAILEHGIVASDDALRERLLSGGYLAGISPSELFALLDYCCDPARGLQSQEDCQIVFGLASPSKIRAKLLRDRRSPIGLPFYRHIISSAAQDDRLRDQEAEKSAHNYRKNFINAANAAEAGKVVAVALAQRLMPGVPGPEDDDFDEFLLARPIHDYGIDSLMAIELRSWFAVEFAADIPVFHILGEGTLGGVGALVASKSKLCNAAK